MKTVTIFRNKSKHKVRLILIINKIFKRLIAKCLEIKAFPMLRKLIKSAV